MALSSLFQVFFFSVSALLFFFSVLGGGRVLASGSTTYVAPGVTESMPVENQQYLIGVISTAFVGIAAFFGIKALMDINYSDDTLLMVEVPEDHLHADGTE